MQFVKQSPTSRRTGQTSVTTTAAPITRISNPASATTTFTTTTAVDAAAWDLSGVVEGDIAETSDGCAGLITAVDDGNDTITVQGWYCPFTGWNLNPNVPASKPADTSTIVIHRRSHVRLLGVDADVDNTGTISIGLHGNAVVADYVLNPGEALPIEPETPNEYLDLTQVYVIASSGTQALHWGVGAIPIAASPSTGAGSSNVIWRIFTDGDTTPAVNGGKFFETANSAPTSITDFDGVSNTVITVKAGDGNTTIVHDASKIFLQGGANITMVSGNVMTFVERSGVWYEEGTPAAGVASSFSWTAIADGDATPDVSGGTGFYTANTGPTSITDFDGATNAQITLQAGDANTTIVHDATKIVLRGALPLPMLQGDIMIFTERGGIWYETPFR